MKRVTINGLGRIGRLVLRHYVALRPTDVEINDLVPAQDLAHLVRFDTAPRAHALLRRCGRQLDSNGREPLPGLIRERPGQAPLDEARGGRRDREHRPVHDTRSSWTAASLIPTTTGAAVATAQVIPELEGRTEAIAIRAPVLDGAIRDNEFGDSRRPLEAVDWLPS